MERIKDVIISLLIIFLFQSVVFASDGGYKLVGPRYLSVDKRNNIYVLGGKGEQYGILKISNKGKLISIYGDEFHNVFFNEKHEGGAGYTQFTKNGELYGPGKYTYICFAGKEYKYMWGTTKEVFIQAEDEKKFNEFLKFIREKPSVENVFKKTIKFAGPIAINDKGEMCVIGGGIRKVMLPQLDDGKISKRKDGSIVYFEQWEQRIGILDPVDGHPIKVFGQAGINKGNLYMPMDITVDNKDNIYVVDRFRDKIIKYSPDGEFIKEWGKWGAGDGEFKGLYSIAIDKKTDRIYIAESYLGRTNDPYDVGQFRVQVFDTNGKFIRKWGDSHITGIGLFWFVPAPIRKYDLAEPKSIAVAPDGNVWVIESHKPCVTKFTPEGKVLLRFGEKGDINGDTRGEIGWYSEGLAVGPDGMVYVCDNGRTSKQAKLFEEALKLKKKIPEPEVRIVKFDSNGNYIGEIK